MPDEAAIYAVLGEILQDVFLRDDLAAAPGLAAKDVEGWDSFKQIEIIMATEERFDIKLSTRDIDGLTNLGDLARVVAARAR